MKQQKLLKTIVLALLALGGVSSAWAGDFIDDASSIEIVNNNTTYSTTNANLTINTTDGKKSLVFTPGAADECQLKFTFSSGYSLTSEKAFLVVEASANLKVSDAKRKVRKLTIGSTDYDCTANGNWDCHTITVGTESHQIAIFSPLSNNSDLNTLYQGASSSMSLKFANVIVHANSTTATTIYSVAMYTLGDLLKKYEGLRTSKDWQYISVSAPRIESNGTGGNTIKIKDTTGGAATEAQYNYFLKTLDLTNLPAAYNTLDFGNLSPSFSKTEDIFTSTQIGTRKIKLSHKTMHKLPTKNSTLKDSENNTSWYWFVDGGTTAPKDVTLVKTGNGSENWGTYTRELKSGYNTVLMPFKKLAGSDYQSEDLTFYKVSSYSAGIATFEKVANTYGSNTFITDVKTGEEVTGYAFNPYIVYTNKPGLYTFVGRDVVVPSTYYKGYKEKKFGSTNLYFVGTFENECPMASGKDYENYTCYGIASNGTSVKKMNSTTTASYYRAFIVDKSASPARELSIGFDEGDGTTEIVSLKDVHGLELIDNSAVYNLQGVRMQSDNLPRGIYVKNGKKFIVK